jgi:hypothetical protein
VCEFRQKPIFPSAEGQYGDGIFNTFLACKRLTGPGVVVYGGGANFENNLIFSDYPFLYSVPKLLYRYSTSTVDYEIYLENKGGIVVAISIRPRPRCPRTFDLGRCVFE